MMGSGGWKSREPANTLVCLLHRIAAFTIGDMPNSQPSGCLTAIFKLFSSPKAAATKALPYKRKDFLLTAAERSLFGVLHEAFGAKYFIFAKVRLADLLWMPKGTESRQSHFNKIQAKHVDFVISDRQTVRPLVAIELDDSSHSRADRVNRDAFVDEALAAAGLPFVRIRAAASYSVRELAQQVQAAVKAGG
jgi:hypothetical protein